MQEMPQIGDQVAMPFMGDDVEIVVTEVASEQPLIASDGFHLIIDQYGETHMVEMDGDSWVIGDLHALSPEGFDAWMRLTDPGSGPAR